MNKFILEQIYKLRKRTPFVKILKAPTLSVLVYMTAGPISTVQCPKWARFYRVSVATGPVFYAVNSNIKLNTVVGSQSETNMKISFREGEIYYNDNMASIDLSLSGSDAFVFVDFWGEDEL